MLTMEVEDWVVLVMEVHMMDVKVSVCMCMCVWWWCEDVVM